MNMSFSMSHSSPISRQCSIPLLLWRKMSSNFYRSMRLKRSLLTLARSLIGQNFTPAFLVSSYCSSWLQRMFGYWLVGLDRLLLGGLWSLSISCHGSCSTSYVSASRICRRSGWPTTLQIWTGKATHNSNWSILQAWEWCEVLFWWMWYYTEGKLY